jgi:hypothetical protein
VVAGLREVGGKHLDEVRDASFGGGVGKAGGEGAGETCDGGLQDQVRRGSLMEEILL